MYADIGRLITQTAEQETDRLLKEATSSVPSENPSDFAQNIVRQIVDSDRDATDKTMQGVMSEILTVTGAGFETTSAVMRLVVYNIYRNKDILVRLRTELDSVWPAPTNTEIESGRYAMPELRALEQLPYLTALLMEGLRLSPGLGTRLQRIAPDRSLVYGQWTIPAGTPVGMTVMFMHTDEKLYPDPWRFDPERWMDSRRRANNATFAPFSRGTRNCLGMQ